MKKLSNKKRSYANPGNFFTAECFLSEQTLKTFISQSDDLIIVFDRLGRIHYVNPIVCRHLGYEVLEILEMTVEVLCPDIRKKHLIGKSPNIENDVVACDNLLLVAQDGHQIAVKAKLIKGKWMGEIAYIGVFRDITNRMDVEDALKESERRLSTLMSNLPGMAYRCKNNRNWTMEFVSEGCYDLTGYKPSDFVDDKLISFKDLMEPEDRQMVYDSVQEALIKRRFFRLVFLMTTKGGEKKWVWEQGVGVYSKDGDILALEGFITDITEHQKSKQQLYTENILLRSNVKESYKFCGIVGRSNVMQRFFDNILQAAKSDANVIIYGESGTGKELAARAIHKMSAKRDKPFVPVNCSAIPENLIESEFFGHTKGAFTGAVADHPGYLESAERGILFLDEIGEINLSLQVKLLRAIEGSSFTPVGGDRVKKPTFRIIAATHQDLKALIKNGEMREDFFYRIHIIPLTLPPLRERKEDIPLLVYHFLKLYSDQNITSISQEIMHAFQEYDWPGNIRELQNAVHRYVTLDTFEFNHMDTKFAAVHKNTKTIDTTHFEEGSLRTAVEGFEKNVIRGLLERHKWHRGKVASVLDINYRTLLRKMKRYELGGDMD